MVIDITSGTRADWLIIFLVLDALDMHDHVDAFLEEVKTVPLKRKNKVYFLTDRITPKNNTDNFTHYDLSLNELVYNRQTNQTELVSVPIQGKDPRDGYAWQEALRQIYLINNPRFSTLITWSHGSGIGIVNPDSLALVINKNEFTIIRNYHLPDRAATVTTPDCPLVEETDNAIIMKDFPDGTQCRELRHLFVSEIASGFKGLEKKPVFDMMVMANCNMQIIDNCYNLKDVARYYFAPITAVQLSGYDFAGFIKAINNDNSMWAWFPFLRSICYRSYFKKISRLFINGYIRLNPTLEKSVAIAVNDLRPMTSLPALLDKICIFFNDNYQTVYPVIDKLLKEGSLHFSETDFVDAVLLFYAIQQELKNETFDHLNGELKKRLLDQLLLDHHIGSELKETDFHYFAIYIPRTIKHVIAQAFCCQYFQQLGRSAFVQETGWDNFVVKFTRWRAE